MRIEDCDSKTLKYIIAHHLLVRDIVTPISYYLGGSYDNTIEIGFNKLVEGFNDFYNSYSNYTSVKKLLRDFDDYLKDKESLREVALDVYHSRN